MEKLEDSLGVPLPAATQWDLVKGPCGHFEPPFDAFIDAAAQGEVLHNEDTQLKILELIAENETSEHAEAPAKRTGLFTSGDHLKVRGASHWTVFHWAQSARGV